MPLEEPSVPFTPIDQRSMTMSVLVPTYRRPADLARCLAALSNQTRVADAIVVVCRADDALTRDIVEKTSLPNLWIVNVHVGGVVAALNAGLARITSDIVAITDDDAAPHPDWLARIEDHFASSADIGGVGGRDFVHGGPREEGRRSVGRIQWFGRHIGNHHLGVGSPRDVHTLKGVNMSFRRAAVGMLRFDERLRGSGAQVHNELAFCIAIRRQGWRLVYDPAVAVDHFPAMRFDEDQRSEKSLLAVANSAYNDTLILLEYLPLLVLPIYAAWCVLVGSRDAPGLVQSLRFALCGEPGWPRLTAALGGRLAALRDYVRAACNRTWIAIRKTT